LAEFQTVLIGDSPELLTAVTVACFAAAPQRVCFHCGPANTASPTETAELHAASSNCLTTDIATNFSA
jgi:hypothetical protein